MKNTIIRFSIFMAAAIFLTTFIGYIDEGNSKNYASFLNYLATDAASDNIKDYGRHGFTIFFFLTIWLTYYSTKFISRINENQNYRTAVALIIFPLTLTLLLFCFMGLLAFIKLLP